MVSVDDKLKCFHRRTRVSQQQPDRNWRQKRIPFSHSVEPFFGRTSAQLDRGTDALRGLVLFHAGTSRLKGPDPLSD